MYAPGDHHVGQRHGQWEFSTRVCRIRIAGAAVSSRVSSGGFLTRPGGQECVHVNTASASVYLNVCQPLSSVHRSVPVNGSLTTLGYLSVVRCASWILSPLQTNGARQSVSTRFNETLSLLDMPAIPRPPRTRALKHPLCRVRTLWSFHPSLALPTVIRRCPSSATRRTLRIPYKKKKPACPVRNGTRGSAV